MFRELRLGRWFGVDVRVDSSWLLVLALILASLWFLFLATHPLWPAGTTALLAALTGGLVVASIVTREIVHAAVSYAVGVPISHATFRLLGSTSRSVRESVSPAREAIAALSGPLSSIVIGGALLLTAEVATAAFTKPLREAWGVGAWADAGAFVLHAVGLANVGLALVNLLPAYPLDGGRLLRAALWWRTGDRNYATTLAARTGRAVGLALALVGLGALVALGLAIGPVGLAIGVWVTFIGWSVLSAASSRAVRSVVEERLRGLTVGALATAAPRVDRDERLARVVPERFVREGADVLVVTSGADAIGVLRLEDVRRIAPEDWAHRSARDAMIAWDDLPALLAPGDGALSGLDRLDATGWSALPVSDGRFSVVGLYERRAVARWVEGEEGAGAPIFA